MWGLGARLMHSDLHQASHLALHCRRQQGAGCGVKLIYKICGFDVNRASHSLSNRKGSCCLGGHKLQCKMCQALPKGRV